MTTYEDLTEGEARALRRKLRAELLGVSAIKNELVARLRALDERLAPDSHGGPFSTPRQLQKRNN